MKKMIVGLLLISNTAFAEKLEDVKILNVVPGKNKFELKLQTKNGPRNSYFYVDIVKSDPESFEKLAHVLEKIMKREKYQLDLDIPSFSAAPNGSYYKSEGIAFYSPTNHEPNDLNSAEKSKR